MTKCEYGSAVQWTGDDDSKHTGVIVHVEPGDPVTRRTESGETLVQVAHSYTCELEFIRADKLSPYPSEPIEQPTKGVTT